jgi:hypothetical protein
MGNTKVTAGLLVYRLSGGVIYNDFLHSFSEREEAAYVILPGGGDETGKKAIMWGRRQKRGRKKKEEREEGGEVCGILDALEVFK